MQILKRRGLMASRELLLDTAANLWPQTLVHPGTAAARITVTGKPMQPLYPAQPAQPSVSGLAQVLPFPIPPTARHPSPAHAR